MEGINYEPFYDIITQTCRERFLSGDVADVIALATEAMSAEGFPMHAPVHHYLVPAVLLTACRKAQGHGAEVLDRDLEVALERARNILPGFCGFYGTCGACVGVGIFWSLITDTTPLTAETWAYGNKATGKALLEVAQVGGPRCCKRCTYLSLLSTLDQISEVLGLGLTGSLPLCAFHGHNSECIETRCPYRDAGRVPIPLPTFAFPKKDPLHPCPCQDRPVELTHKTAAIFWSKAVGEQVSLGETVAELECEKKVLEIPAPATGILVSRAFEDGTAVAAGAVLGHLQRSSQ